MDRFASTAGIVLGATYTDQITRYRGVAVGIVFYMTGCNQVLLDPGVDKDGKRQVSEWFDEQRLTIGKEKLISLNNEKSPGFDAPAPRR